MSATADRQISSPPSGWQLWAASNWWIFPAAACTPYLLRGAVKGARIRSLNSPRTTVTVAPGAPAWVCKTGYRGPWVVKKEAVRARETSAQHVRETGRRVVKIGVLVGAPARLYGWYCRRKSAEWDEKQRWSKDAERGRQIASEAESGM